MATASRKTSNRAPAKRAPARRASGSDALSLLRADHRAVSDLFAQYEKSRAVTRKRDLVAQICLELSVHAQIEEEIFYPEVETALRDKELVPEAKVEHATLKELIAQIKDQEPGDPMFEARVQVLSEYVKHHVKEEQNEMFPKVRASRLDLEDLGRRLAERKDELKGSPELLEAPPRPAVRALAEA